MTTEDRQRLLRWLGYAQEIQRGTQPGDAQVCAKYLENEIEGVLRALYRQHQAPQEEVEDGR